MTDLQTSGFHSRTLYRVLLGWGPAAAAVVALDFVREGCRAFAAQAIGFACRLRADHKKDGLPD